MEVEESDAVASRLNIKSEESPSKETEEETGSVEAESVGVSETSSGTGDKLTENEEVPKPGEVEEENGTTKGESKLAKKTLNKTLCVLTNTTSSELCEELKNDQLSDHNFTDLDIICSDGHIPVHRCLLMGASKFLRDLLIEKDIRDASTINLPDVSVHHLSQILSLLYCGKTVISKADEGEIFQIMIMLGLPVIDLQYRVPTENDIKKSPVVRYFLPSDWNDEIEDQENVISNLDSSQQNDIGVATNAVICRDAGVQKLNVDESTNGNPALHNVNNSDAAVSMNPPPIANDFKCEKCGSSELSEQGLFNHLESSDCGSMGILNWMCYEDRKCLKCEYRIPNGGTLQTLLDHVSSCAVEVPTMNKEIQSNHDSVLDVDTKRLDHFVHSFQTTDGSIDVADKSFEEACSGLEQQMERATQKQHSKRYQRKRNIVDSSEEADNKSVSSMNSRTSGKSSKRRKTSGSSNRSLASSESLDPLDSAGCDMTVEVDVDVIRKEFSISTQMDIHNLSVQNLHTVLHKCPICKFIHPKMKTAAKCLRHHGYRICFACLKVFAINGPDFDEHAKTDHLGGTEGKVTCPLCTKEFEFNVGLPTHIGNYHYRRIMESHTAATVKTKTVSAEIVLPEEVNSMKAPMIEVQNEERQDKICSPITSPSPQLQEVTPRNSSDSELTAENSINEINSANSSKCTTSSLSPPKVTKSIDELSETVKSCQICKTNYQFSECATKCLKSHGYKRCWACFKPFLEEQVSEHIKTQHVIPGSPNMVECFLCLNSYAYNKGLNLHVGKHFAVYDRQMGIKPMKRKKNASNIRKNYQSAKNELISEEFKPLNLEEKKGKKSSIGNVPHCSQPKKKMLKAAKPIGYNKRGRKPKNLHSDPAIKSPHKGKADAIEPSEDKTANGKNDTKNLDTCQGKIEHMGENEMKSDPEHEGVRKSEDTNNCDMKGGTGEVNDTNVVNASSTPTNRVFLEVKEILGTKYKVYGLMDPINGVQSGKTIAVPLRSDEELEPNCS
ncbi:unnamed protein product [Orchesella dallaii]|uniref:BTB domain-containing protein n=1 Tax=Orchesella dallaii TaxID=48710 RepID=A0ABP1QW16_9HEXA